MKCQELIENIKMMLLDRRRITENLAKSEKYKDRFEIQIVLMSQKAEFDLLVRQIEEWEKELK